MNQITEKEIMAIINKPWLKLSLNMNTPFNTGYEYVPEIYNANGLIPTLEEFENECSAELADILKKRKVPAKRLIVPTNFEETSAIEAQTPLHSRKAAATNLGISNSNSNKGKVGGKRKHRSNSDKTEHSPSSSDRTKRSLHIGSTSSCQFEFNKFENSPSSVHSCKESSRTENSSLEQTLSCIDISKAHLKEQSAISSRTQLWVTEQVAYNLNSAVVKAEHKPQSNNIELSDSSMHRNKTPYHSSALSDQPPIKIRFTKLSGKSKPHGTSSGQSKFDKSRNSLSSLHSCKETSYTGNSSLEKSLSCIDISKVDLKEQSTISSTTKLCLIKNEHNYALLNKKPYNLNGAVVKAEHKPESNNIELSDSSMHSNKRPYCSSILSDQPPIKNEI